jgi:hypothetical protein
LESKLEELADDKELSKEDLKLSSAVLIEKLAKLQKQRHKASRLSAHRLEGEIISRYWSMINKLHRPYPPHSGEPGGPGGAAEV